MFRIFCNATDNLHLSRTTEFAMEGRELCERCEEGSSLPRKPGFLREYGEMWKDGRSLTQDWGRIMRTKRTMPMFTPGRTTTIVERFCTRGDSWGDESNQAGTGPSTAARRVLADGHCPRFALLKRLFRPYHDGCDRHIHRDMKATHRTLL